MGRPREFNIEKALDTASDLFWRNGYDGTSVADLTAAIKITPPSFYLAFGSKERLFEKVLDRYLTGHLGFVTEALAQPSARAVAERLLNGSADAFTDPDHPPGCLTLNCSLPCPEDADPVRRTLAKMREETRVQVCKRFKRAKASGDLPADANPEDLARFVMLIAWGLAVEAQSGASRKELRRAVAVALKAWPA